MGFFSEVGDRVVGAPSILAADFAHLADDVRRARDGGAELIHFDVLDNQFVPNLTIGPLVAGRPPFAGATRAFRLSERLRPWSMAEIFIIGVAVALVKVAGLATVSLGPAFWAFAILVLVTVLQDNAMCRYTIWKTLEQRT